MSVADETGVVHQATSVDTWRTILNAVIDNVTACVIKGDGAGGVLFANSMCCSAVDFEAGPDTDMVFSGATKCQSGLHLRPRLDV